MTNITNITNIIDVHGVLTVLSFLTFLGIVFWSYSKRRKASYDEAANLPFVDEIEDVVENIDDIVDDIHPLSFIRSNLINTGKQYG